MRSVLRDFSIFLLGGLSGLFGGLWPHIQKPLTDYRQTLRDISELMLRSVDLIHGDPPRTDRTVRAEIHNEPLIKFDDDIRVLHARLISSVESIPRFARPVLRLLGLLRTPDQIKLGAQMLIGISNQVLSARKDKPYLTTLIKRLGAALDVTV